MPLDHLPTDLRTRRPNPMPSLVGTAPPVPVVVDHEMGVLDAINLLDRHHQAMGFVVCRGQVAGIVTLEDLVFTWEWAGPDAQVADAVTLGIVQVGRTSTAAEATLAFHEGLHHWLAIHAPHAPA